jgi:plastocyanin
VSRSLPISFVAAALLGAACGGGEAAPALRRHLVEIRGFEYHPDSLTVAAGDTVVWVNRDVVPHTASAQSWDSGSIAAGGSWTLVVTEADEGGYICAFHPSMKGWITIR